MDKNNEHMKDEIEVKEVVIFEETANGVEILDLVIVEDWVKIGKPVPRGKKYRIKVDKVEYVVHHHEITGEQILALAGKKPAEWKLYQVHRGRQPVPVPPAHVVDLCAHEVERFTTVPKDPSEGLVSSELKREFKLPATDEGYLEALGLPWETRKINQSKWVVIHGWSIPTGYNVKTASLALMLPNDYPDIQIDMAFFKPELSRADGRPIANLSATSVAGEPGWQQWSRHRTPAHPWRPGIDDLSSHLALVDDWPRREFGRV